MDYLTPSDRFKRFLEGKIRDIKYIYPKNSIEVHLLYITPLSILFKAVRSSRFSYKYSDYEKDKNLVMRLIKLGHHSVLEHIVMNFEIYGITRLCLQELVRHRIASYTVQSTRYVLKKLIKKVGLSKENFYFYFSDLYQYSEEEKKLLLNLLERIYKEKELDKAKRLLPESFRVHLFMTINMRSFRNFINLRLSKEAHFEIRELAKRMVNVIPENYKFLIDDILTKLKKEE